MHLEQAFYDGDQGSLGGNDNHSSAFGSTDEGVQAQLTIPTSTLMAGDDDRHDTPSETDSSYRDIQGPTFDVTTLTFAFDPESTPWF